MQIFLNLSYGIFCHLILSFFFVEFYKDKSFNLGATKTTLFPTLLFIKTFFGFFKYNLTYLKNSCSTDLPQD